MTQSTVPTVKLHTGQEMPIIGLGTFLSPKGEVAKAVEFALNHGYRHIDGAACYNNEAEIGTVLGPLFRDPNSKIKREDVFITSKLWNTCHKKEQVLPAIKQTLKDLQIDYLDLYLVHMPIAQKLEDGKHVRIPVPLQETWQAMEELVRLGLTKAIGVSNWNSALVNDLLSYASIKPAVNQIERHPYLVQREHVDYCRKNGIEITAYSPLGAPGFGGATPGPKLMEEPVLAKIAAKYNKSVAQVLIRWSIDDKAVVIPKSVKPERIVENFNVFDFTLSKEDSDAISALDKKFHYLSQDWTGVPIFT